MINRTRLFSAWASWRSFSTMAAMSLGALAESLTDFVTVVAFCSNTRFVASVPPSTSLSASSTSFPAAFAPRNATLPRLQLLRETRTALPD